MGEKKKNSKIIQMTSVAVYVPAPLNPIIMDLKWLKKIAGRGIISGGCYR
jgi:hypothetical protein